MKLPEFGSLGDAAQFALASFPGAFPLYPQLTLARVNQ